MRDSEFEWDDRKAASNLRKHHVSFGLARLVFADPSSAIDDADEDEPEDRSRRIGIAEGIVLVVIYTMRGERVRIISARKASKREQDNYFRQGA
jgi:uncharacterized DUF497 family protein